MHSESIVKQFCLSDDLATYDPSDIWKAGIGVRVKSFFNISRLLGAAPALALPLYDQFFKQVSSKKGFFDYCR